MFSIAVFTLIFLAWRSLITAYNWLTQPYLRYTISPAPLPLVSILIPARNEAQNIVTTLQAIIDSRYNHCKIWVLDDNSTDATLALLQEFKASKLPTLQIIEGTPLPKGWLGKNWACYQLAQAALQDQPDYLLFLDADVHPQPQLIEASVQTLSNTKSSLLSLFPDQQLGTWGEKITVPLMHYILLTFLPLLWVRQLPFASLAAANGQFMLFEASHYREHQWHEKVKNKITEDIEIVKTIKATGLNAMTLLPQGLIYCRMYPNGQEAIKGFSKNILAGFGNNPIALVFFLCSISISYIAVYQVFGGLALGCCALLISCMNILLARLSNQPIWETVLLQPLKIIALWYIALRSIYLKITKKNTWKGRNIN